MPRVKRGTHRIKRRANIMARTKGFMWGRKNRITLAKIAAVKAGAQAYVGRKLKKRDARALAQVRINAAVRELGTNYSKFMNDLKKRNITLNRQMLAKLAMSHKEAFKQLVKA